MVRQLAVAAIAAAAVLATTSCATNPANGGHNVVFTSVKGEQDRAKREHLEIIQFYGLYEDQAVQDYVQSVGAKVAAQTPISNWNFKFFVLDDDEVNAFTPGGGYVYIHRGLMNYLNSEAELAAVLGHEIGHDVARHPARAETRGVLMSVGAVAAAIASGSEAVAQMANIGDRAMPLLLDLFAPPLQAGVELIDTVFCRLEVGLQQWAGVPRLLLLPQLGHP